jgi:SWI/SNF-related matrix-associated actin-dependent regulator of chromatin subfamily A member 5
MQELGLNYPTTTVSALPSELLRMRADDVHERIKKDIAEFPVFRFDWFFKSRSPQELQRRCNTLLGMIEKEAEVKQQEGTKATSKGTTAEGKVCSLILCLDIHD